MGVGWVLGVGWPAVGCCVAVGCWVLQGGDDEVSRPDALQGVSRRSLEPPITLASRSVGVHLSGVGCWVLGGRWVLGVGCATGSPPGVQVDDEVTSPETRYLARRPRSRASQRYRRGRHRCPVGLAIAERWVLGVGCWVGVGCWMLGVGCEAGSPPGSDA